ncbi:MAG: hypothetical protein HON90_08840 [Halobacteriovoraceae bacterium]|nr:hypothetical protein [Halobacteriovoraceae bacterium]
MSSFKTVKFTFIKLFCFSLFIVSCAPTDEGTGTTGGNPVTVTIQSSPYTNDGSTALFMNPAVKKIQNLFLFPSAYAATINDFKFCITQLKVVTSADGQPSSSQEARLGLVDVSTATVSQEWGQIELADGSQVSEIHFEVHTDAESCSGENYSVSYNSQTITKDLEFKFKFDPAVTVSNGDTFTLGLGVIAQAIENASAAIPSQFNNEQISNYLETTVVGTGTKE